MSISIVIPDDSRSQTRAGSAWLDGALSFLLVVVFPTVFWLGVAEVVMMAADYSYGHAGRMISGMLLGGFLTFVWAVLRSASDDAHQR